MTRAKVAIPVSRTNYNRYKYRTHSLEKVLELEGKETLKDGWIANPINGEPVALDAIELVPKKKVEVVAESKNG